MFPEDKAGTAGISRNNFDLNREAEISALKKENDFLRKELSEVLLKYEEAKESLLRFEIGILSTLSNPGEKKASERESQVLKDMLFVREKLEELRLKTRSLLFETKKLTLESAEKQLTPVEKAGLQCAAEDINDSTEKLCRILSSPERKKLFEKCEVLEVHGDVGSVILTVGTGEGAFCGLLLRSEKKDVLVKIIAVRPFVSAAVLIKGKIEEISPGMVFIPGKI